MTSNEVEELKEEVQQLGQELEKVKKRKTGEAQEKEVGEIEDQISDAVESSGVSRRDFLKSVTGGAAAVGAAAMLPNAAGFTLKDNKPFKFTNTSTSQTNFEVGKQGNLNLHGNKITNAQSIHTERAGIKSGLSRPKETVRNQRMPGRRQATVCIIYDDGYLEDKTEFLPVHEEKGAPFGSSLITSRIGTDGFLSESDIHDLVTADVDWEPLSHGRKSLRMADAQLASAVSAGATTIEVNIHTPFREGYEYQFARGERFIVESKDDTTLTLKSSLSNSHSSGDKVWATKRTLELDLGGCKKDLNEMGLTVHGHVFSGNLTYGPIGQQIASQYFGWARSDMGSGANYPEARNSPPLNRFALNGTIIKQIVGSGLGSLLDTIEANNELGVFYGHGNSETASEIETFIDEVQARDIDIVTPTEAVARFTTPVDTPTPANRVAESDRTLFYPFVKSSGSTVYDASGRNNDGSFDQNPARVVSHLGRGANFIDADGNHIRVPHDPSLNPGTESWTFTAWVRYQENPGRIIDKGDLYIGQVGGGTNLRFFLDDGSSSNDINISLDHGGNGDLFQIAAVRDAQSDEMRLWANATHDRGGNTDWAPDGDINPTNDLYLGGDSGSTWDMEMFVPQIYQRALTREELLGMHLSTIGSQAVEGDLRTVDAGDGLVVTTPDGSSQYRIRVDNSGNVVTDSV